MFVYTRRIDRTVLFTARGLYLYGPVFVGYVHEDQSVQLNHEHSDYRWMTFDEAKQNAALPGIDDILDFVEKHFARKVPSRWMRITEDK